MTTASNDADGETVIADDAAPGALSSPTEAADEPVTAPAILDLDTPEDLPAVEAAPASAAPAVLAATVGYSDRLGEVLARATDPQIGETARRVSELVAGFQQSSFAEIASSYRGFSAVDAAQAIMDTSAVARATSIGTMAELVGKYSADRAAFSIASGLKVSDSVTASIGKLMAETGGVGITKGALAATIGQTMKRATATDLGLAASSSIAALMTDIGPKYDFGGIESIVAKSALADLGRIKSIADTLTTVEIVRSRSVAMQQLVATSGIGKLIGSDKMVASWRQSLLSEATARSLIGTIAVPNTGTGLLRDIVAANSATARVVGRYAELNKASILTPTISARPTRELRSFLAGMPVAPDLDDLTFAVHASRSVAGLTAADLIMADGTIEDEAGELLEAEIVEPWLTGPDTSRSLLFSRLGGLDAHVPELLRGAWTQVETDGPAATSMASHAVQEAIDRTLRALAPAELVLQLFAAGRLPTNAVYEKDGQRHPTRAGRIAAATSATLASPS